MFFFLLLPISIVNCVYHSFWLVVILKNMLSLSFNVAMVIFFLFFPWEIVCTFNSLDMRIVVSLSIIRWIYIRTKVDKNNGNYSITITSLDFCFSGTIVSNVPYSIDECKGHGVSVSSLQCSLFN